MSGVIGTIFGLALGGIAGFAFGRAFGREQFRRKLLYTFGQLQSHEELQVGIIKTLIATEGVPYDE